VSIPLDTKLSLGSISNFLVANQLFLATFLQPQISLGSISKSNWLFIIFDHILMITPQALLKFD